MRKWVFKMIMYIAVTNDNLEIPKFYREHTYQLAIDTGVSLEYIVNCIAKNEKLAIKGELYKPPVDECKYRFEQVWV